MSAPEKFLSAAKAWVALAGAIVTGLLATVPAQSQTFTILTYVAAVCTAIATFAIPNRTPAKHDE